MSVDEQMGGDDAGLPGAVAPPPLRSHHQLVRETDHLCVLPPSANWYCSKVCDWGRSDAFGLLFAFGAKNSVFIYQVEDDTTQTNVGEASAPLPDAKVSFFAQLVRGKRDRRVTSVHFLTDSTGELRLVCGGEEGGVQIWDVVSRTMIEYHRKHKAEVMAVTVSGALDANFVVAGDRQGRLSAWQRDTGKVSVFLPISGDGVHSMALSPHDKTLVAVGYRSGVLCLVDAAQGTVRHRLDGHDQEIQCVAWKLPALSHSSKVADAEEDRDCAWLASSSRDKTIKIWKVSMDASTEPVLDQVLRLPRGKQGMSFSQTKQLWLPVAWSYYGQEARKHRLWSGSADGSLFLWEWSLAKTEDSGKRASTDQRRAACKPTVVKGGHNRMLFSIVMVPRHSPATSDSEAVSMLTVSLDRELRLWKEQSVSKSPESSAATCVEKLGGLGGHAYSVAYNPATSIVAAGIGDQTIRLWQLDAEKDTVGSGASAYQCDLLWKGLQSKVTCVQWHPFQHALLGYGTEDGRVGIYDTLSMKHTRFRSSHGREVQQLQWRVVQQKTEISTETSSSSFMESIQKLEAAQAQGRTLEEALAVQNDQVGRQREVDEVKVLLWSCDAGGQVLESNAEAADQSSQELKLDCSTCAWDEQCQLIAVGRTKGSVEVLNWQGSTEAESTVVYRFHEHVEAVTCVSWSKGEDAGLLASGSKNGTIFVYSCGSFEQGVSTGTASPDGEGVVVGGLVSHSGKVTDLQWCSEAVEELLLASSSVDGTVQVWNAKSQQRVAHFDHHVGRVLSLDWVSPFVLVTGGEDQTLRLWDYRPQQAQPALPSPPLVKQIKSPKTKKPQQIELFASSGGEYAGNAADNNLSDVKSMERQSTDSSDFKKPSKSKSKKKKTLLFHPEAKLTSNQIAVACHEAVEAPSGSLPVHSSRAALREFLTAEEEQFRGEQDWESVANMLLLQGKIGEALRVVAKEGALTSTWLAYAPMAGLDVWRDMTNVYAHQLDAQGDKKAAALHFLSISKIRSAVGCLVSGDAYKEALALIQVRLSPHDPLLHETLWKYADFLVRHGRQGEAALEFLRIGSIQAKARAVHALISVGDMRSVETALDVLLAAAGSSQKTSSEKEEEALSFPASFFFSIAGRALATSSFSVAEKAGQLLQSRVASASAASPPASYRLTRCLLGVMKAVDEHRLCHGDPGEADGDLTVDRVAHLLQPDAPESVREFFTFLMKTQREEAANEEIERLYRRVCCLASTRDATDLEGEALSERALIDRSDRFWAQVLNVCRASGYWFDSEGEAHVEEAQELLVEGKCFAEITKAVAAATSGEERGTTTFTLLQVAQCLLRLVVDVMSVSFVSALECMHESFALIVRVDDSGKNDSRCSQCSVGSEGPQKRHVGDVRVDVMTLLFPIGFVSLSELPQCGELAEEQPDTLLLCSSILLSHCTIVLMASLELEGGSSAEQKAQLLDSLLRVLRREFLQHEEAQPLSQGLMDAGNQQQLQQLLNEVLVAAYQLPDGLAIPVVSNGEVEGDARGDEDQSDRDKDCKARRGGLISEVNAVRERLTWSPDAAAP